VRSAICAAFLLALLLPVRASAQESCGNVLVFTLPGVTWQDVERERPPALLQAIEDGAAATMAVRTNEPITDYASGFLTIGTGTRANAEATAGGAGAAAASEEDAGRRLAIRPVIAGGFDEILERAEEAGYGAEPGSLASSLDHAVVPIGNSDPGDPVPSPFGFGRYALLAAMDEEGVVDAAYTGEDMLSDDAAAPFGVRSDPSRIVAAVSETFEADPCGVAIVDPGDLIRADMASAIAQEELAPERNQALASADALLAELRALLDEDDLLLIATPTSPRWDKQVHLGVAVAVGDGFEPGATLRSGSTNRSGVVALPDVAPTVLAHQGVERPPEMLGRELLSAGAPSSYRVEGFARFDREAVFMHYTNPVISTVFVIAQVILYALAVALLWAREGKPALPTWAMRALELGALAVTAFPLATYLSTPLQAHELGGAAFSGAMLALTCAAVLVVWFAFREALDRFFALVAATFALVVVDQFLGGPLQLNAVWGIDPITAGRFIGLGNISFAILGVTGVLTGALLIRKWRAAGWTFVAAGVIFILTIVVDGAPSLGADVGGVLALVPALGITFMLLTGRRPSWRVVGIACVAALVVVGAFLVLDLARPPESRTHLARFYEDVRDRGAGAFTDVIFRKARANLRLFQRTIWTYLVPVALGLLAYLVLRPKGAWSRLAGREPRLRAALIGGMLVGIFGFAVNDSGIVVTAMVLTFLVPLALIFQLRARADET
jgi:hypothetical protein